MEKIYIVFSVCAEENCQCGTDNIRIIYKTEEEAKNFVKNNLGWFTIHEFEINKKY